MSIIDVTDAAAYARELGVPPQRTREPLSSALPIQTDGPWWRVRPEYQGATRPTSEAEEASLAQHMPRHPRGVYVEEPQGIRARLSAAGKPRTVLEHRRALESFALSPEWFPASPERDAAAMCEDAIFPWGREGEQIDRSIVQAREAAARAAAEAEERARIAALPNRESCREAGVIPILLPMGSSVKSWPEWLGVGFGLPIDEDQTLRCAERVDGGHVILIQRPTDDEWPAGPIEGTSASVLDSSFVPRVRANRAKCLSRPEAAYSLRRCDPSAIVETRDLRTPEGEHAVKLLREWAKPRAATLRPGDGGNYLMATRLFVQRGVRGLSMRPELVVHVYRELGGAASDEKIERMCADALSGAHPVWYSPDEVYAPPKAGIVERFANFFADDEPWREVLESVTLGRTAVSTASIVEALTAAGLIDGQPSNEDFRRVGRLMAPWESRQITIDGRRVRGYARS